MAPLCIIMKVLLCIYINIKYIQANGLIGEFPTINCIPICLGLCAMPPTSFGGSWRAYRRRSMLLSILVLIALLSLVYIAIAARKQVESSPSSRTAPSMRSHSSSSQHEHKWCPYYPASVDEIDNIFDSNSLLDLHIIVQTTLTKDTPISLLVASESVLPMLINWMCVTRQSTGSLPENLLVVVPPGDSSVIMNLESKGISVVQMEFRWVGLRSTCPCCPSVLCRLLKVSVLSAACIHMQACSGSIVYYYY